jgi:hypothetical protein
LLPIAPLQSLTKFIKQSAALPYTLPKKNESADDDDGSKDEL